MPRARPIPCYALLLAALLPLGAPAHAGCAISTTGVNFGAYNPQNGVPLNGVGTIDFRCSDDTEDGGPGGGNKKIAISAGNAGSFTAREMRSGADKLDYNLYTDASRTSVWGDGQGGSDSVKVHPQAESVSVTVYGRIPAGQNVRAGTYTDTLIVSIEF